MSVRSVPASLSLPGPPCIAQRHHLGMKVQLYSAGNIQAN
jgi:hypothetical protein